MIKLSFKYLFALILLSYGNYSWASSDTLNTLFPQLKNASNETEARSIENKIWQLWFKSGDEEIDFLLLDAVEKRKTYDFNGALSSLNKIIEQKPNYPEAWNQRAIVNFYKADYEQSLRDVAKTLELEPRHFGAMAGRAVIRLYQGRPTLALQNIVQALEYHPFLQERNMFPSLNLKQINSD